MSHLNPGLISAYNSLTDKHLAGYFSNTRIRRHLQRAGLITRSGRIVPDKEYRHKLIQRAHQRHVRECLAQAIFHKVLEMERLHQIEIKRKLEEFARRERVHKIKVERSRRYEEDIIRILSPRPPTGARGIRKQHSGPEGEHSESSESPGSSRPNTAPGKMQRPVRLKPIHSNSTTASVRRSSPYRLLESTNENDQPFNCTMDKESRRRFTTTEASCGISPYCLPVINNFVTPVPPATKRKERGVKVTPSGTLRGRRLRPTTASSGADDPPMLRSSMHQSRVCVNMVYFGKTVHLSHDLTDMRDEVKVFQQHCGGENLCVYKGKLREGETFQLISRRHRGFPFSLTFFLNGLQVERLSSCCEFKHRKGSRLGGRHGHFGFSSVEGASPCYKCIIAMGLDKKPTPPPKRVKEDGGREELVTSPKDAAEMEAERAEEETASRSDCDMSQQQDMETQVKEERVAEEDKVRDDYEEDFEADDEGPVDEAKEKKSPCPAIETETLVKERDASETEDDDEKDEDTKSRSGSSCSGSDQEASDAEATNDSREDEKAEQPEEVDREEAVAPSDQKDEPNPEEPAATEAKSAAAKDSDLQDSAGDSTEIDISDTSIPSGKENKQSDDTSGGKEAEATVDEGKQEEEQEQERGEYKPTDEAVELSPDSKYSSENNRKGPQGVKLQSETKSVQEKLAEAILKESHCSSEPELSDTSTEEEEEATEKGHKQNNNDVVPEKSVTFTEQQPTLVEEVKCEESAGVGEAEVTEEQEETSEPKEREDETEKEPHENSDSTKEETEKIDEDDEKPASEEAAAEEDKSEDTGAAIHPALEETMEESKTSEPQEDAAAKPTDADAAQRDEENEEKSAEAEEAGTQPDETGQGAKSREGDESSVSDPNKKTDETAMSDNAEAEAMTASETMEMKAEPSEEREALSCEEAPVTDTEERQQGDSKDRSKASVTAENSNSMLGGSGDTTVEKTADVSEDNAMDESSKDDNKEEEVEEFSEADASKDDNQQERLGEEQTEKSVEISNEVEKEKSEEQRKEEEKQTNPDETPEGENTVETEKNETDKTEEANDESKTEERIESEGNIVEDSKTDSNTEGQTNEEPAEKTLDEEDKVANEERADESEKTKKDDDSECVENKNDEEESETKAAITDKTNEGEEINEAKTDADEEKGNEAEQGERDDNELNKAEQSESEENKDAEESEEKKIITCKAGEGEEISDITEEPEKNADDVKISNENTVEPKDMVGGEAADGTEETEEMLNNVMESEDGKKEAEGASANSKKGEIDAENGEINTATESKTHEDEAEASAEDKNDVKPAEHVEDERKTEDEPTEDESTEVKEVTVESGHDNMGQAPDTDMVESEAKEVDDCEEKQDESAQNDPERETVGTETKEESKADDLNTDREDNEETTQDENENKSDKIVKENRDSDSTKNNGNNVNEVITASLVGQAKSSTPTGIGLDGTSHKLDESTATSDKLLRSDESAAAVDLSAADGENGADTEEASKASEEGASVLLKPRAQNNEADNKEESIAIGKGTPEALTGEDNTDLVTNWVTMHQTSKYFEKFVEPLEDLKEETSHTQGYISTQEATKPTELPRSESPLKMVKTSENEEKEQMQQDENDAREKTKVEAVESDLESELFEDGEPYKIDPAKDTLQEEEGAEVKDLIPKTETEENDEESINEQRKGSRGSLEEDKVQDGPTQAQNYISQTEVESIVGTHHSVASGKPESLTENKNEEETTDNDPDLNEKQIEPEEIKDLLPPSKTEEHREHSASPDGLKDTGETWWKTDERSREVTEITDFTTSKSDDGSQDESHNGEIQPKPSDGSVNRERRDMQLIQDIKHTLSKDRLSTFSVDETLFGRSSYPVLAAARTESGH
ncbi:glutamate-rich protein 3 [Toxotes jaculatrix]|uniref:glutamate-rich protein 3 n=1 Tax=Toxotes jaculatrix TaxID=941984 RepID=UPI001B3A8B7D|nr:glutamate-rich protein 3 [Toxotes jaculatrix]